jgi:hypothetical protein
MLTKLILHIFWRKIKLQVFFEILDKIRLG